jgi:exo-beta-1,3-glucanase (GH17 family)
MWGNLKKIFPGMLICCCITAAIFFSSCKGDNAPLPYKVYGIDFSPYMDGQDPNLNTQIPEQQLHDRMNVIFTNTTWIRTYSCLNGLENAGPIAHGFGLKVALGAAIGSNLTVNDQEISSMISIANSGGADLLIVGNGALLRGDVTSDQLITYIRRVKSSVSGIKVGFADDYSILFAHPEVINECDVIFVNFYPFKEGWSIDYAVGAINIWYKQLVALYPNKTVYVSETGWPSQGNPIGNAVPSLNNEGEYFLDFVSWAKNNNVYFFYFEAFDESWRANYEGSQGAYWGLWDKTGNLKSGMSIVFTGNNTGDNWSTPYVIGGTELNPSIIYTHMPPVGSTDTLTGTVNHVAVAKYKIAVYIYTNGAWKLKPLSTAPTTNINLDGTWACDITTESGDESATIVDAFIIPRSYIPPTPQGTSDLPAELYANSIVDNRVVR